VAAVLGSISAPSKPNRVGKIPRTMGYLRMYVLDMAYTEPPSLAETPRTHKRRVYNTLDTMSMAENSPREMRVTKLRLFLDWVLVWKNLHTTWVSEGGNSVWYIVIHDQGTTNERLNKIRLSDSVRCGQCERQDTLVHRVAKFGEGTAIWEWTHQRLACILRTDPCRIPTEWLLCPQFQIWPPQRQGQFYRY